MQALMPSLRGLSICVFCGARNGADPRFVTLARRTGALIAASGATLVYGGGSIGLMGQLADGALEAGGEVVGVIPRSLLEREVGHAGLTRMDVVEDMQLRKQRMIAISDAFLTLPGGFGTLDELFEVLTLRQLGEHALPILLVDDQGYFSPLMQALRAIVANGLAADRDLATLESFPTPEAALARLGGTVTSPAGPTQPLF
jgi:uncharacterized protein (TIGR00730 family)